VASKGYEPNRQLDEKKNPRTTMGEPELEEVVLVKAGFVGKGDGGCTYAVVKETMPARGVTQKTSHGKRERENETARLEEKS